MGLFRRESVNGKTTTVEVPYRGQQVAPPPLPTLSRTVLIKSKRGKKMHTGITRGDTLELSGLTYCGKELPDAEIVQVVEKEGYAASDDWIYANLPHDQLCQFCFVYLQYCCRFDNHARWGR